ncbi:MAG: NAD(P)H-hydrate dehydratase [Dehalococcoidia bacterium]|nr:NAD(P)H-hydrate dehydratase [Dehalococcoidia bacterium]MSQ35108.1 NAD(P)H-hydrate dehydratase [Dehalococcoidia bacterium]
MKAVTAAQMRHVEQRAADAGVSQDRLMENAGLAIANAVAEKLGNPWWKRVVVLVGPGNNGGDGLVAARHLAGMGARVECMVILPRKRPDAHRDMAVAAGVKVLEFADCGGPAGLLASLQQSDIIIDAVFGTGQNRLLGEPVIGALRAARHAGRPIVAVDLPTGVESDTGSFDPNGLPADVTLMLGLPKLGPVLRPVEARLGDVSVLDIGLPAGVDAGINVEWLTPKIAKSLLPGRPGNAHKGTFGRVLIIAGSRSYVGAALLATRAATRSGAGLVELATPQSVWRAAAGRIEEAIYLPLAEGPSGEIDPVRSAQQALRAANEASALLIGPGLGQGRPTSEFATAFLASKPESLPSVLDADALNILASGYRWWERVAGSAVLTPHPGEMGRLLGTTTALVQGDRLVAATTAAKKFNKIIVLKGAATVIASTDGDVRISPWVNSGLAKAGTGDVLAGLISGLLAQMPSDSFGAASLGVYIHGLAGDIVRRSRGESGMTAGDVAAALPDAFLALSADTVDAVVRTT